MDEGEEMRPVVWMGDSLKRLRSFPDEVRNNIGHSLFVVQGGLTPSDAKPLKGIAGGIFEIVARFDGETYRAVYAVRVGKKVYVLHVFQKKSKTGIKTPQKEIDLIFSRLKEARSREGHA